jgi:hypothetical protein
VQKDVGFLKGHTLVQSAGEVIDPDPVLPAHVLFLPILLLLASKEQALCEIVSKMATNLIFRAPTSSDLLIFQINQLLEPKNNDVWGIFRMDSISNEV